MTQAELQTVLDGGAAESPSPFDGADGVSQTVASWAPSGAATSYQVYLGTSQAAVAGANTGSPEYQGSTTDTDWTLDLEANTNYFWRVDTVTASSTITGSVWNFTTGPVVYEAGLIAHWKMDEGSGGTTGRFVSEQPSGNDQRSFLGDRLPGRRFGF